MRPVADPDLVLRGEGGGGGVVLLALLTFSCSVISSFITQNNRVRGQSHPHPAGWAALLDPLLLTATKGTTSL